ncbi:hypothetical protein EDC01DRAFT_784467 [Geopyxis carbonaria]|nr:hypothetical protein EDC01DRAFT_784467 [Geopyxis carbonaria]
MPFCTSLRNFFCCACCSSTPASAAPAQPDPGCCAPFTACLRSFFCCSCTCCGNAHAAAATNPPVPLTPLPRPGTGGANTPRAETRPRRAKGAAAATAGPQKQPRAKYRKPDATVAPLPALPPEVADHVERYQRQLVEAEGRIISWVGEEAEEVRDGRRRTLLWDMVKLQGLEDKVAEQLEEHEGTQEWRKQASRRRTRMERALSRG